ncbi:MAG: ABC transporter ATP-binding protein [Acidobacteria bacterium]|nr:ABC transporter ATP-binding protein [Acidobacteriota bacterium]
MGEVPMTSPIVQLSGVGKVFGTWPVLTEVQFSLVAGERILFFGPNGAGKSTLLRIIASLSSPTSGSVLFYGSRDGVNDYRRKMGYLGHSTSLYPDLTGEENLAFFSALRGISCERSGHWLEQVGLDRDACRRRVRFYSAGMKQRLAIARLLLHDPEILLLDEPFNALDGSFVQTFLQWIREKTVVLVTHQLELSWPLASRAYRVSHGRIKETEAGPAPPAPGGAST